MTTVQPIKYNPSFLSENELMRYFVVRQMDLELIMEVVRENTGPTNQHVLVIGSRGAGKTMLVLRTAAEIRQNEELNNLWYPIVFAEESYEVCSPGEFWLEVLFHLGKQTKEARWQKAFDELRMERDESRLRERALSQVMDFADEQGKRLLLVVENLNMLLGEQISLDDAWVLRHPLLNEPNIMLLGTATSRFEHLENSGKAMFELFKIHELKPLDSNGCRKLWASITGKKLEGDCIKPMKILTGGNPRLLVIISAFAAKTSFKELMDDLTRLVDEHTEYFKSHLDNLPPLERKVFVALADLWKPSTAREVADAARIDVNKASAYLKRLLSKGAVVEVDKKGRRKWYQLAERMYNIYHLMRRRGEPSNRVRAVVHFMVHFYPDEELVRTTATIASEACALAPELRHDHYLLLEGVLKSPETEKYREKIVKEIPKQFFESPDLPESFRKIEVLDKYIQPKPQEAPTREEIQAGIPQYPEDPMAWVILAKTLSQEPDRSDDVEKACLEAIKLDPENVHAWAMIALLQGRLKRYEEAVQACRKVIAINPNNAKAWGYLGSLLHFDLERYEEAEQAYRKAVEIDSNYALAWESLGLLLHYHLGSYAEAAEAYKKAIEIDPDSALAWKSLGELLHFYSHRYEEAEQAYRKAIDIDPNYAKAWSSLGFLLHDNLQRYEEAEEAYRKVIEIDPNDATIWSHLGRLLHNNLQRYEEAEKAYRKAIDIDPKSVFAWGSLGFLLHDNLQRYEEAEKAYRNVVEMNRNDAIIWSNLGRLLHYELQRYKEAEKAYRKAIDIDPSDAWAWVSLGFVLRVLQRYEEAEEAYRKAVDIDSKLVLALGGLGFLLHDNLHRYEEAEEAYRKVLEIDPKDATIRSNLGRLLHDNLQRYKEAEEAYRKAIEIAPTDQLSRTSLIELQMDAMRNPDAALKTAEEFLEFSGRSAESLNNLAGLFLKYGWHDYLEYAESWSREAVREGPDEPEYQYTLASILGALGKWTEALEIAPLFLGSEGFLEEKIGKVADFFITAAASDYAEESLRVLEQRLDKPVLEPLISGLKIFLGEKVRTAQEIMEVGEDVAKRIHKRMAASQRDKKSTKTNSPKNGSKHVPRNYER
ncbi:MAG: tetratricopeptide repeat protein [Desulfobacterales bacterium]|nr:tetratricopeptide repeat protein [Desulfobacterales bacterium]